MPPEHIMRIPSPINPIVDIDGFLPIIEHHRIQMLRGKKQLGTMHNIYPGAEHTRFEHTIGVFQIAGEICDQLGIDPESKRVAQAYALLHDMAHIPFSHNVEPLMTIYHDDKGREMIESFANAFAASDVDGARVLGCFERTEPVAQVVKHKVMGADRLDYMFRDPYHVGRGDQPDVQNIIRFMVDDNGKLASDKKNAKELERTQHLYYDLHDFFYYLKQYVTNNRMLQRAVQTSIDAREFDEERLYEMVDTDLEHLLLTSKQPLSRSLMERLRTRTDTYKPVVTFRMEDYVDRERSKDKKNKVVAVTRQGWEAMMAKDAYGHPRKLTELEDGLAETLGVEPGTLLISAILDFDRLRTPADTTLVDGNGTTSLFSYFPGLSDYLVRKGEALLAFRVVAPATQREQLHRRSETITQYLADCGLVQPE